MVFTPEDRDSVLARLVQRAADDPAVLAAALFGSLASGDADGWSDVDLALRISDEDVARRWTDHLYAQEGAVHHVDMWSGPTRYCAFLLGNALQVDVSFWTSDIAVRAGRAVSPLFGAVGQHTDAAPVDVGHLVGMGWLYAVHARSALARGRLWQGVHMIDGARDQAVGLACLRHGLPAHEGRGVDLLPEPVHRRLTATRAGDVDERELAGSLDAVVELLLDEIAAVRPELAARIRPALLPHRSTNATIEPRPGS